MSLSRKYRTIRYAAARSERRATPPSWIFAKRAIVPHSTEVQAGCSQPLWRCSMSRIARAPHRFGCDAMIVVGSFFLVASMFQVRASVLQVAAHAGRPGSPAALCRARPGKFSGPTGCYNLSRFLAKVSHCTRIQQVPRGQPRASAGRSPRRNLWLVKEFPASGPPPLRSFPRRGDVSPLYQPPKAASGPVMSVAAREPGFWVPAGCPHTTPLRWWVRHGIGCSLQLG